MLEQLQGRREGRHHAHPVQGRRPADHRCAGRPVRGALDQRRPRGRRSTSRSGKLRAAGGGRAHAARQPAEGADAGRAGLSPRPTCPRCSACSRRPARRRAADRAVQRRDQQGAGHPDLRATPGRPATTCPPAAARPNSPGRSPPNRRTTPASSGRPTSGASEDTDHAAVRRHRSRRRPPARRRAPHAGAHLAHARRRCWARRSS